MTRAVGPVSGEAELDCQACAACCCSPQAHYVPLSGADHARLTAAERDALVSWTANACFMRMEGGRCAALVVARGRYLCGIYERRPTVCRELAVASPACSAAREQCDPRALAGVRSSPGSAPPRARRP